jgi:hypothetical protein
MWSAPPAASTSAWNATETVRELLVCKQGCCAFMSFTLTPSNNQLVADLGHQIKRLGDSSCYVGSIRSHRVLPRATQPQQGQSQVVLDAL